MTIRGEEMKVLYAPVSGEFHRSVRIKAIQEGKSVGNLVAEAVRAYLDKSATDSKGTPLH